MEAVVAHSSACRGQHSCILPDIAAAGALSKITLPSSQMQASLQAHAGQRMQAGLASNARPAVFACFPATKPQAASQAAAEPLRPFPHGQAAGVATSPASGLKVGLFGSMSAIVTVSGLHAAVMEVSMHIDGLAPSASTAVLPTSMGMAVSLQLQQINSMSAQLWCS